MDYLLGTMHRSGWPQVWATTPVILGMVLGLTSTKLTVGPGWPMGLSFTGMVFTIYLLGQVNGYRQAQSGLSEHVVSDM